MKTKKKENLKASNVSISDNDTPSQGHEQEGLQESSPNPIANRNYGTFEFDINQEFIQENKKISLT